MATATASRTSAKLPEAKNVGSALDKMGGEGMAEGVERNGFGDSHTQY